jgi:hypothetical protein
MPARATHPCTSPLILDLDGDHRIATTGLSRSVLFDVNADGELEEIGWTSEYYEEAFLWMDSNHNRAVDSGRELFGNATLLPDGTTAESGFEALAVWDDPAQGGNGDGLISHLDRVWSRLRLWIDRNHDASTQSDEIATLPSRGIRALGLDFRRINRPGGNLNVHFLEGSFVKRVEVLGESHERFELMEDVLFTFRVDPGEP